MKASDIMSSNVTSLELDASVEVAAQLMKQYNIGSIPICDNKKVVGIVTDRDIAIRSVAESQDLKHQKVSEIMTTDPVVGSTEMSVHEVSKLMSNKQIRRLPIVKDNNLVGIVALGDIALEPRLQDNAEIALKSISKTKTF
jgi:CBS domain-containing protein